MMTSINYSFEKEECVRPRYLKSIFPKAEETLILDVLANKDNNVQKASEELQTMGFSKKETLIKDTPKKLKEKDIPTPPKKVVTIMKTLEEKNEMRKKFQRKYSDVAERIISIALESVDYNEERADQILAVVQQEENGPKVSNIAKSLPQQLISTLMSTDRAISHKPAPGVCSVLNFDRFRVNHRPILKSSSVPESAYKSPQSRPAMGPDPRLRRGPKDSILLENYVTWNGPNPELRTGTVIKAEGPEPRCSRAGPGAARGRDPALGKGPAGLAKGSAYQKLSKKTYKVKI
ncbi:hypothetical protein EVAR_63830_1 [Eumeta japonica]|uniref:CUE domain-containing protein n=1 Tax=Eumeta variegata TaxID=151549 RepID=A0A4C2ABV0_EUMVA|nr:hypothetical protein EVAR_63830_1 [Eumeta japonica]